MPSTTNVPQSATAEIAQLRFALNLCWQALDICEPLPENKRRRRDRARGLAWRVPQADRLEGAVNIPGVSGDNAPQTGLA